MPDLFQNWWFSDWHYVEGLQFSQGMKGV